MTVLDTNGILVQPVVKVAVCRDSKTTLFLEIAETAKADYIVTRDKDLFDLLQKEWRIQKLSNQKSSFHTFAQLNSFKT